MYTKKTYRFKTSIEYEYTWYGEYGRKKERGEKKRATPEQIRKQNQRNRENHLRRKIKLNFEEDDCWTTLKYPAGTRIPLEQLQKALAKFVRSMRGKYKRKGEEFRYIARIEVGKNGGPHIHILHNRHPEGKHLEEVKKSWLHITGGSVNMRPLTINEADKVAEYIAKQPDEDVMEQLSLFPEEERQAFIRYTCSRNLKEPVPEVKEYRRRTVEKLVKEGPTASEGFYIDKNSMRSGVNPYTGKSYLYYTEIKGGSSP